MAYGFQMTGSQAETAVRDYIHDPTGAGTPRFRQTTILGYLNRALTKFARDTETLLESRWSTDLATGVSEIPVPENMVIDKLVWWENSTSDHRRMTYLTIEQMRDYILQNPSNTGPPKYYWFWRRLGPDVTVTQPTTMTIYPVPTSNENGKTLRVMGYKLPDEVTEETINNVIELEGQYMEGVIALAASMALHDDRDYVGSQKLMGMYNDEVQRCLSHRARRSRSERSRVRPMPLGSLSTKIPPWKPYGVQEIY